MGVAGSGRGQALTFSISVTPASPSKCASLVSNVALLVPIAKIPPAEAEERYYAMLDEQKRAA